MLEEKILSQTQNPYKELSSIASRVKLDVNELDFNLLSFSTQYRFGDTQWNKISEKELVLFDNDETFLKENLQIKQEYKIEIFHNPNHNITMDSIKLVANKALTKIIAEIEFHRLKYHDKLALELLQGIYKKMLKLNFFIGIRIFDFKKELISLVTQHKTKAFKNPMQLIVARGVDAIPTQNESLILNYQDKTKNYTLDEKISGIIPIDENEVAIRHLKAKRGKEGKNLNLHILNILDPKEQKLKLSCSNAFKVVENENSVDYIATKKGFVVQNAEKYDISNVLDFNDSIDFKSVGVIRAGLDKNITINVKFSSDMQDAVNSGVKIECEELNIAGSVANNTELRATKLKIDGTTNSKAMLYAKDAHIKNHRGYIEGENVSIDLLENGTIKAKVVKIKKSLGGNIEADKIYIEDVTSNNSCTFYQSAIVERFEGENNKFLAKIRSLDKDYDKEFIFIKSELEKIVKKIHTIKQHILTAKNGVLAIEKKVNELKNAKQSIPPQYEKIIKEYNYYNREVAKLENKRKELLTKESDMRKELVELQKILIEAKFINKSGKWTNMNEVRFALIAPKEELFYSSTKDESAKSVSLRKNIFNNEEIIEIDKKIDFDEKDTQWLSQSKE